MSQKELAQRLGIRRASVTQWESPGGTLPSTANLLQTAVELGVPFEWLATGRGQMRLDATEGLAFSADCIARSFDEERLLALFRGLNIRQRESLVDFLGVTVTRRRVSTPAWHTSEGTFSVVHSAPFPKISAHCSAVASQSARLSATS